jgi:serine phosphatase RsbU (regulator of sigma subunit)
MRSLSILFYSSIIFLSACQVKHPTALQGKINLSKLNFQKEGAVKLDGQWEFYWEQLLTPEDFKTQKQTSLTYLDVPKSWTSGTDKDKKDYPGMGYATYRLKITLPDSTTHFGLLIPQIWSSSKVWINERLVTEAGKVSNVTDHYQNKLLEKLINFKTNTAEIEIVVQVANLDFFIGGILIPFQIGNYYTLLENKSLSNAFSMMWLGALLLMSLYHLVLYFFRKKNMSTLYFGIACFLIFLRIIVFGGHYLYDFLKENWGILTFAVQSKTYYITSALLTPIALLYIQSLYPKETNQTIIKFSATLSLGYSLFLLLAPPIVFTSYLYIFDIISIPFLVYLVYILIMASIHSKLNAIIQMLAVVIMVLAALNDELHGEEIEIFGAIELTPYAFALLVLLQIFIIAQRFSYAFAQVEDLSLNLEKKVERRTLQLKEANEVVQAKSDALESQNKEITDSINYAQRIQKAMLPTLDTIQQHLPETFILFKPRDIVSGDFYYFAEKNEKLIIAAVDCTGHGVPGAFMSMIGNEILTNLVEIQEITEADKILNELNKGIRQVLKQEETAITDGMDMSLIVINKKLGLVEYAGAKNQLIYIKNGIFHEIKADKISIGGEQKEMDRFYHKHQINLHDTKNDTCFYLFSDGYQDQFGGDRRKKFMLKNLRNLFMEHHREPMEKQKEILDKAIMNWMHHGHERQIDDILVIGVRI